MSAAIKPPHKDERTDKARTAAKESRSAIERGDHAQPVKRLMERFPKIMARLAK